MAAPGHWYRDKGSHRSREENKKEKHQTVKQRLGREQGGSEKDGWSAASPFHADRKLAGCRGCLDGDGALGDAVTLLIMNFYHRPILTTAREAGCADNPKGLTKAVSRHSGVGHSWNPFAFVRSGLTACQFGSPVPMARPKVGWAQ